MLKRRICMILAALMVLGLSACGGQQPEETGAPQTESYTEARLHETEETEDTAEKTPSEEGAVPSQEPTGETERVTETTSETVSETTSETVPETAPETTPEAADPRHEHVLTEKNVKLLIQ